MTLRPRRLMRVTAVAAIALLAGCASVDAEGGDEASDAQVSASVVNTGECVDPPALPSTVPTFGTQQAPSVTDGTVHGAVLHTSCGDIELELFGDKAPVTVASFDFLAGEGYWDASPCHRLTTAGIYVLQCGDPTGTGRGGPGYTFGLENAPEDGRYPRGTVAMARSNDPNSNGGQFFIVFDDTELPVAGGGYTIFGRVTTGMDIIDHIAEQGVDGGGADGLPVQPISILSVEITEEKAPDS